jgi:hypothetical protein
LRESQKSAILLSAETGDPSWLKLHRPPQGFPGQAPIIPPDPNPLKATQNQQKAIYERDVQ